MYTCDVHNREGPHRRPKNMFAWLIVASADEASSAALLESKEELERRARDLLSKRGFPTEALATFHLGFTSLPDIEAGGGRFAFFR